MTSAKTNTPSGAAETETSGGAAREAATEPRPFTAPRIPKMAEVIADELRARILAKEFTPGESLFPESQLMAAYNVSRPTLREALRLLEAQHLVSVRRGSHRGPVVTLPDVSVAAESFAVQLQIRGATLGDVYQFRAFIEPQAVELAATRATEEDVAALRTLIAEEEALLGDASAFAAKSWSFHQLLLELSGNVTAVLLGQTIQRINERHSALSMESAPDRILQQHRALKAHERIVDLIADHDAEGARAFWSTHMTRVAEVMESESPDITVTRAMS